MKYRPRKLSVSDWDLPDNWRFPAKRWNKRFKVASEQTCYNTDHPGCSVTSGFWSKHPPPLFFLPLAKFIFDGKTNPVWFACRVNGRPSWKKMIQTRLWNEILILYPMDFRFKNSMQCRCKAKHSRTFPAMINSRSHFARAQTWQMFICGLTFQEATFSHFLRLVMTHNNIIINVTHCFPPGG